MSSRAIISLTVYSPRIRFDMFEVPQKAIVMNINESSSVEVIVERLFLSQRCFPFVSFFRVLNIFMFRN